MILSFDPGETTGVCLLHAPLDVLLYDQMKDLTAIGMLMKKVLDAYGQSLDVVYENFLVAPSVAARLSWNRLPAPRVIGVIEEFCSRNGIQPHTYLPANKKFFTDDKMKEAGAYWKGMGHAVDAARHALYHSWITLGHKNHPDVVRVLMKIAEGD